MKHSNFNIIPTAKYKPYILNECKLNLFDETKNVVKERIKEIRETFVVTLVNLTFKIKMNNFKVNFYYVF